MSPWIFSFAMSLLASVWGPPRLSVLMFHKLPAEPDPLCPNELLADEFVWLLDFIEAHCHVLPLTEAVQRARCGQLAQRTVCLTFDDGYPEWLNLIAPALRIRQLPATFFVTTGQLSGEPLWHERLIHAVRSLPNAAVPQIEGICVNRSLDPGSQKVDFLARLLQKAKYLPLSQRAFMLATFERALPGWVPPASGFDEVSVRWLAQQGFEIGAHTINHPILTECSEAEALSEIGGAKEQLESIVRQPVRCFAYPNGRPGRDYARTHVEMVRQCGYGAAVSTARGSVGTNSDILQLPRFGPWRMSHGKLVFQLVRNAVETGDKVR
jgi:peptidoglycan/xylan/chitin deacetylase (PgdA/CDA1 family)